MSRAKILPRILQDFSKSLGPVLGAEPGHDLGHAARNRAGGHLRTVDQDDRQVKGAGGDKLRLGPRTTGVLGDDDVDAMVTQKDKVALCRKRAAGNHGLCVGQGQGIGRRIDKAQKVVVLRGLGETGKGLATDGQEDPARGVAKGCDGRVKVGDMGPVVFGVCLPGRAFKGDQRGVGCLAGGDRVAAHPGSEGVGGVDDMGDGFGLQVLCEARDAAKSADADGQRLGNGGFGPARVGIDGVHARLGQRAGHLRGLGRSAQKKDARHG